MLHSMSDNIISICPQLNPYLCSVLGVASAVKVQQRDGPVHQRDHLPCRRNNVGGHVWKIHSRFSGVLQCIEAKQRNAAISLVCARAGRRSQELRIDQDHSVEFADIKYYPELNSFNSLLNISCYIGRSHMGISII